ncbi:MAG: MMPL family transporter, partial [Methanospirillum sp.]|uniref:efflux RND transporter permease subunit n=1 Tax=Methanospirillum sp. TaxID=45200 RepID=UPI0023692115
MPSLFSHLADLILAKPGALSKIILVLMAISLFGMTMVSMSTGNENYLQPTSTEGILDNHYSDTFKKDSLIILIESGDSTSPSLLKYIDTIEKPISNLQYISSVSSIVDIVKSLNNQMIPTSSGEMNIVLEKVPESAIKSYAPTGMLTMVPVNLESGLSLDKRKTALKNLQNFIDSTDLPPGVSITITGTAAFKQEMEVEMGKSLGVLISAAMVLMVIVLGLLFGYVNHRFLPVVIVAFGLIFTFGFVGLAGMQISMAVISAFPVIIGLGIDYAIQFHSRLEEEARDHPLPDAIKTTVTKTGPAVLYAMLATCMGFIAMFLSPVPMMQGFGLVSIIGVITCYITSLIGIPLIATLINYKPKGHGASKFATVVDTSLSNMAVFIAKRSVPILLITLLFAIIGLQLDPMIPVDTNEKAFVPPDMPAKATLDKVTRTIGSTDSVPIMIRGSDVVTIKALEWMQEFIDFELKTKTKITRSSSILDYLQAYNNGVLPKTQSELDQVLGKIPENIKETYLRGNNEALFEFNTVKIETKTKSDLK